MTRDDIIQMAKEAGYGTAYYGADNEPLKEEVWGGPLETRKLVRFAALVAAAEREACAVLVDECGYFGPDFVELAVTIRARGESK